MIDLSTTASKIQERIHLTSEFRCDIQWWNDFLPTWNGSASMLESTWTVAADMELFTDASATLGYGIFFKGRWISSQWPHPIATNNKLSIAWKELLPILLACLIWGHQWHGKRIQFHCDNLSIVNIWKKGSSRCPLIMRLVRRLFFTAAMNNFHVMIVHVKGTNNDIADSLSRQQLHRFRLLAPHADQEPTATPDLNRLDILP
ncbi:uncharacterized protein LOC144433042 [Glandiceps talaboti]